MAKEIDYIKITGKLPTKDKNGNDITGDKLGKGGFKRKDGTFSGMVYDIKIDDSHPQNKKRSTTQVDQKSKTDVKNKTKEKPLKHIDDPTKQKSVKEHIGEYVAKKAIDLAGELLKEGLSNGFSFIKNSIKQKIAERKSTEKNSKQSDETNDVKENSEISSYAEREIDNKDIKQSDEIKGVMKEFDVFSSDNNIVQETIDDVRGESEVFSIADCKAENRDIKQSGETNGIMKEFDVFSSDNNTVQDPIDVACEQYEIYMTSEEAQKELLDAFILRLISEKKLWKLSHAKVTDSKGNITDGQEMLEKLTDPKLLNIINTILSNNINLLETWQMVALTDILERELIQNGDFIPIESDNLKMHLTVL